MVNFHFLVLIPEIKRLSSSLLWHPWGAEDRNGDNYGIVSEILFYNSVFLFPAFVFVNVSTYFIFLMSLHLIHGPNSRIVMPLTVDEVSIKVKNSSRYITDSKF